MTVVDHTIRTPRRSWLEKLRAGATPPAADKISILAAPLPVPQKPPAPMADLLIMSAVDQKAPPDLSGGADLLDALVHEHLERGSGAAPEVPDDAIAAPPAMAQDRSPASSPPAELSPEERAAMLQREIDLLLRDAPEEPASQEGPAQAAAPLEAPPESPSVERLGDAPMAAPPLMDPPPVANDSAPLPATPEPQPEVPPPVQSAAEPAPLPKDLSPAELDVLLARESTVTAPEKTPEPGVETPLVNAAETEQKLTEAEGVLAAELSQLIAESSGEPAPTQPAPPAEPPSAAPPTAQSLNPIAAARAEELNTLTTTPVTALKPEPAAQTPASAPATTPPPCPTPAAAPAPAADPHPGPAPVAASAPSIAPTPAETTATAPQPGLLLRLQFAIAGGALMVGQLLDLPFNWLDDLSRNVVGVAAFLLLLGGIVLWVLSHLSILGG